MDAWEETVKVALLGTERQKLSPEILSVSVQDLLDQLVAADPEDTFLKTAALLLNYTQAGSNPLVLQINLPQPAEPEEKPVCSDKAAQTLATILEEGFPTLILDWLQHCTQTNQQVREDYIPVLLDEGKKGVNLLALVKTAVGNRGKWLASFNEDWQYIHQPELETWEQGKLEERKQFLRQIRQQNPVQARELLIGTWKEENANTRAELLSLLEENLSIADELWLKELQNDKSQKVKEVANTLLSQLSESEWIQELWQEVKLWISLKTSKSFIAFTKEELEVKIPETFPAILKKKGLQELSNTKNRSDHEYWLNQILTLIPPAFWEKHLEANPGKVLHLFSKNKILQKYIPALIAATIRFKDAQWALVWLNEKLPGSEAIISANYLEINQLLNLVSETNQKNYLQGILAKKKLPFGSNTIDLLLGLTFSWDVAFSITVMQELADAYTEQTMYYGYYRLFELHLLLHPDVLPHFKLIEPINPALTSRWQSLQNKLIRALEIRQDIRESFSGYSKTPF